MAEEPRPDAPEGGTAVRAARSEDVAGTTVVDSALGSELAPLLEALLFVSDGPVAERTLARVLGTTPGRIGAALETLGASLVGRGLRLQRGPEGAQLVTAPELSEVVETFLGVEGRRRLSAAAMETLAIIAYRQPVTRGQIERIRGVSSDAGIATLRARDLISEVGRAPGPGRPTLFGVTQRFLEHFGMEHLRQLPPLPPDLGAHPEATPVQRGLGEQSLMTEGTVAPDSKHPLSPFSMGSAAAVSGGVERLAGVEVGVPPAL